MLAAMELDAAELAVSVVFLLLASALVGPWMALHLHPHLLQRNPTHLIGAAWAMDVVAACMIAACVATQPSMVLAITTTCAIARFILAGCVPHFKQWYLLAYAVGVQIALYVVVALTMDSVALKLLGVVAALLSLTSGALQHNHHSNGEAKE